MTTPLEQELLSLVDTVREALTGGPDKDKLATLKFHMSTEHYKAVFSLKQVGVKA